MEKFGNRLKRLRKQTGLNQLALAVRCGWENYTRISNYESGTRTPDLDDIRKLADVLRVSPHYLAFGETEDQADKPARRQPVFVLTDPAGKSMVIAPELAHAVEDLVTAWATNAVTKRHLHAYRTLFRADANMDPPPPLPKQSAQ